MSNLVKQNNIMYMLNINFYVFSLMPQIYLPPITNSNKFIVKITFTNYFFYDNILRC